MPVVFGNDILERIGKLVMNVLLVIAVPKPVMHAVESDINKMKVIPLLIANKVPHDLPLLAAHFKNLITEPIFFVGAEASDVGRVVADKSVDFFLDFGRICELVGGRVRRKKASHADAVDFARRITRRHTDDDRLLALLSQIIPNRRRLNRSRIGGAEPTVSIVRAIAETVHAERPRVLAGGHAHPGRYGDRRNDAFETAPSTALHETANVRKVFALQKNFRSGAVETEY